LLAIAAPAQSARSLTYAICGWTRSLRPQSVGSNLYHINWSYSQLIDCTNLLEAAPR